jgi:hypothetical protein
MPSSRDDDQARRSFSTNQELVIVPEVRDKLLDAWGIDAGVGVGEFSREQSAYLDYHRANVFKHQLLGRQASTIRSTTKNARRTGRTPSGLSGICSVSVLAD